MNKEDILMKSRAENKGSDIFEKQVLDKSGAYAARAGMLLCCIAAAVEVGFTGQISMGSWMIYFGMLSVQFFSKYRLMKKQHELYVTLLYGILFLMFAGLFLWQVLQ